MEPLICPKCGTEYHEPVTECDWCPGKVPQPRTPPEPQPKETGK